MGVSAEAWKKTYAPVLRRWWARHRTTLLWVAVMLMTLGALQRLGNEFSRLLWQQTPSGAVDLKLLHEFVHRWFAGMPIYSESRDAVAPPATYVILWPLLGWLAVTPARWLWAVSSAAMLSWLVYLILQGSGAEGLVESLFVAMLPLAMYSTAAAIGNGQFIVIFLPIMLAGLLLLYRGQAGWSRDLLGAALLLVALVKPTISLPFVWIMVFAPRGLRPAALVASGYVALTLFATSFQVRSLPTLLRDSVARGSALATEHGSSNLHIWLATLRLKDWILPASLLVLLVLGFWTYRHRDGDIWLQLGVTALVARFWAYHRLYDNLLVLPAMIALFRIAKRGEPADGTDAVAGVLLMALWVTALAPVVLLRSSSCWGWLAVSAQTILWIIVLIFLLVQAQREESAVTST